ncbi:MAG TPA: ankyrin repeat domain-containing protein [Bacilli bacterium]|nr:ankyrin repeat domain-containing protein [Bacilli bacterium]
MIKIDFKFIESFSNYGTGNSEDIVTAVINNDCLFVINYLNEGGDILFVDDKKETLLHKATRNHHYEIIDMLIRLGMNVNANNTHYETPLHQAVRFKNSEAVELLLLNNANVNAVNKKKQTPLHLAVTTGKLDIIDSLLTKGAKVNFPDEIGMKAIHYAAKNGKQEVIRQLINAGASILESDDRGNTPLHYACENGLSELITKVLRHTVIVDFKNIYGQTALHIACANASVDVVRALVAKGYSLEAKDSHGKVPIDYAIDAQKFDNAEVLKEVFNSSEYRNRKQKFQFHEAIRKGNIQLAINMIDSVDINERNDYFVKPIYYAILSGNVKLVEELLKKGAEIENIDALGHSALLLSIYCTDLRILELLLQSKANPNESFYDRTPLYRAIMKNNFELFELLIKHGADILHIDSKYRSLYSYALENGNDKIIEIFNQKNANRLV